MSAINRWNRSTQIDRAGELVESDSPALEREVEQPPIEAIPRIQNPFQNPFQDGFDAVSDQLRLGVDATHGRRPVELALFDRLLTTEDFQQHLQETLDGTSLRAQQVKQVESVYEIFWKDSQDFAVGKAEGTAVTRPELPRYEAPAETAWKGRAMTVPEFPAVSIPPEAASEQQAAQASAALLESQLDAEAMEQPLSLLGRAKVRA